MDCGSGENLMDMGVKDWKNTSWKEINVRKLWRIPRPKLGC
jgi:hypothetical protein